TVRRAALRPDRAHQPHARAGHGDDGRRRGVVGAGMHQVIIYTIGRKSGNEHKVALPVWYDDEGNRIVVASYAGNDKHPHWYLNLADKDANPEVRVRAQDHEFWADAQILEGSEYDEVWKQLVAHRAY